MKFVCSQQKEIKMKSKIILFLILIFVSNISSAHDVQTDKININHPYVKTIDNKAYGYMKIVNKSTDVDRLIGIDVSFAKSGLYDAHMHDGDSPMKKIDYVEIPPQKAITLKQDSYHIMFSNLIIEVIEDMMLEAKLTFEKSGIIKIAFIVDNDDSYIKKIEKEHEGH